MPTIPGPLSGPLHIDPGSPRGTGVFKPPPPLTPLVVRRAATLGWTAIGEVQDGGRVLLCREGLICSSGGVAYEVHGAILKKYNDLGGPTGTLGYPLSDESPAADGSSRFNQFEHGWIYWTTGGGAFAVGEDGIPDTIDETRELRFKGPTPVGGTTRIVIHSDGSYEYSGHLHDSGIPDYSDSVACTVIATRTATAYTFVRNGKMTGALPGGSRDDDWAIRGTRTELVGAWLDIIAGYEVHGDLATAWDPSGLVEAIKKIYPYVVTVVGIFA